jgi:hypothetical protein
VKQKHVVVGGGNLGCDITKYGMSNNLGDFKLLTTSNDFKYPTSIEPILDEFPDHVWVAVGAGSVEGAKKNFAPYADLHIRLVMELAQKLPKSTWLHTFSTNYVNHQSLYALSKKAMEDLLQVLDRLKTRTYQVQSLYGWHKPLKTFPFKIIKNYPHPGKITLPANMVTPTPTPWLAKVLLENLEIITENPKYQKHCLTPVGSVTTYAWAQLVLGDNYEVLPGEIDPERPKGGHGRFTLFPVETWQTLWDQYWNQQKSVRRRLEIQIRESVWT